jgi:hypothetical protein
MFYVYKNTIKDSERVAEFSDRNHAMAFMEYHAYRDDDPNLTGYAVRDYELKIYAEIES